VKTAISIPDDVFRQAERLARTRKMSRSQLYTTALIRFLEAEPKDDVTRAYDSAFDDDAADDFVGAAARSVLETIDWTDG
jgi:predicted transcriptional regulator